MNTQTTLPAYDRAKAAELRSTGDRAFESGDYPTALTTYEAAARADPAFPPVYYKLAKALTKLDRKPEAKLALTALINLAPELAQHQNIVDLRAQIDAPTISATSPADVTVVPSPQLPAPHDPAQIVAIASVKAAIADADEAAKRGDVDQRRKLLEEARKLVQPLVDDLTVNDAAVAAQAGMIGIELKDDTLCAQAYAMLVTVKPDFVNDPALLSIVAGLKRREIEPMATDWSKQRLIERSRMLDLLTKLSAISGLEDLVKGQYRTLLRTAPNRLDVFRTKKRETLIATLKQPGATGRSISEAVDTLDFCKIVGLSFVRIPKGDFLMGSPESEPGRDFGSTESQHRVAIPRDFQMSTTEITQAQWQAVMGNNPSNFKGEKLPVENVSWNDARDFCQKLSELDGKKYRLPTEAEWEYACRAGTTTAFNWGTNQITPDQANYNGEYAYDKGPKGANRKRTLPVGSFKPNAWGLYDMHGNVWEWCEGQREGEEKAYPQLRGSSWNNKFPERLRSAHRGLGSGFFGEADDRGDDTGFRLILD
ncbi:MAG: SUMF1/EgtB/PvdO family nonheme iron enzyme [Burkholderiales bacterium]|nr:SUMF1/EgtB/PvdO family nonheme iron enzyme [Phycisphaerae bacterium]